MGPENFCQFFKNNVEVNCCGGLNKNGLHRLIFLNAWLVTGGGVLRTKRCCYRTYVTGFEIRGFKMSMPLPPTGR